MKDAKYGQRGRPWERFTDGAKKDMQRVEGKEDSDMEAGVAKKKSKLNFTATL